MEKQESDKKILCVNHDIQNINNLLLTCNGFPHWRNPSLGGTTRNHLKEWLRNQKQPNHFFGPFN